MSLTALTCLFKGSGEENKDVNVLGEDENKEP